MALAEAQYGYLLTCQEASVDVEAAHMQFKTNKIVITSYISCVDARLHPD